MIGRGRIGARPYEVAVRWEDSLLPQPSPLAFSEGSGHASWASNNSLADVLHEAWTEHLEICDCLWLRDLAIQERALGRFLSSDEIFAASQARNEQLVLAARAARRRAR